MGSFHIIKAHMSDGHEVVQREEIQPERSRPFAAKEAGLSLLISHNPHPLDLRTVKTVFGLARWDDFRRMQEGQRHQSAHVSRRLDGQLTKLNH